MQFDRQTQTVTINGKAHHLPTLFVKLDLTPSDCTKAMRHADTARMLDWLAAIGDGHGMPKVSRFDTTIATGESLPLGRLLKELATGTVEAREGEIYRVAEVPPGLAWIRTCGYPCTNPNHTEMATRSEVAKAAHALGKGAPAPQAWEFIKGLRNA